jgi:excisionase family DNA binding protein
VEGRLRSRPARSRPATREPFGNSRSSSQREGGMSEQLLYRPEEVAKLLGIGRTRVFELMKTGELPSVKIGASRRITRQAVVAYVRRLERVA